MERRRGQEEAVGVRDELLGAPGVGRPEEEAGPQREEGQSGECG